MRKRCSGGWSEEEVWWGGERKRCSRGCSEEEVKWGWSEGWSEEEVLAAVH